MQILEQTSVFCSQSILHAGAVLDPGVITNIAIGSIRNEFGGKVEGASKLASMSAFAPLQCFNLFSSLAAFSGSGGQGGYAAANGVLDSQAQQMQVFKIVESWKVLCYHKYIFCHKVPLLFCQCYREVVSVYLIYICSMLPYQGSMQLTTERTVSCILKRSHEHHY